MAEAPGDLERAELWALRDFFEAAPSSVGAVLEEVDGIALMLSPIGPGHVFNRALGAGLSGATSIASIERLGAVAARHGLPWSLSLWPEAEPADLESQLAARGFSRGYAWMKFRHTLARIPQVDTSLRVELAGAAQARDFARIVAAGFELPRELEPWLAALCGRPGWDLLLAHDGGRPVAAGAAFSREGLAWVGFAATLPSHRRWGGQGALIGAGLRLLRERGVRTVAVETGERVPGKPSASYRNLLRYGFEEVYLRQNLRCPELAPAQHADAVCAGAADVR